MTHPKVQTIRVQAEADLTTLRQFVAERVIPGSLERDAHNVFPIELYQELHRLGWLQAFVPKDLGGRGSPTTDLIWIARELGYGSAGMATSATATMLALVPLMTFGRDELRAKLAADALSRFSLSAFCFTEAACGSDILAITTEATPTAGGYLLRGRKAMITNGSVADHLIVVAKVAGVSHPKKAMTAFYVPKGASGLKLGQPAHKTGLRDSNTAEVGFEEVFVPTAHRVGEEGAGLNIAAYILQRSRTLLAAAAVGLAHRALELAQAHLGARKLYGKPLIAQPTVSGLLAQLRTELEAAWYLTCASATQWDAGIHTSLVASSMAKLHAGQTAVRIAGSCLELFGGAGCMQASEIERLTRDAKFFELLEGPVFVQQAIIAKELYPEPRA